MQGLLDMVLLVCSSLKIPLPNRGLAKAAQA